MNIIQLDKPRSIEFNMYSLHMFESHMRNEYKDMSYSAFNMKEIGATEILFLLFYGCKGADDSFELPLPELARHINTDVTAEVLRIFSEDMNATNKSAAEKK